MIKEDDLVICLRPDDAPFKQGKTYAVMRVANLCMGSTWLCIATSEVYWPETWFKKVERPEESSKITWMNYVIPDWKTLRYPNNKPMFSQDGTMLDDKGNCSIFDDVDN